MSGDDLQGKDPNTIVSVGIGFIYIKNKSNGFHLFSLLKIRLL